MGTSSKTLGAFNTTPESYLIISPGSVLFTAAPTAASRPSARIAAIGVKRHEVTRAWEGCCIGFTRCAQVVDALQDDGDEMDSDASTVPAAPLDAAARMALLRQLPPDARPATEAALTSTGGADTEALQSALEVGLPHAFRRRCQMSSRIAL